MANTYIDIRKNRQSETFSSKSTLLGLDKKTQVEILNGMYNGNISFILAKEPYSGEDVIHISEINPEIRILELPEVESLGFGYVNIYKGSYKQNKVTTLKIPKSAKELRWSDIAMFHNLASLWFWDTTELVGERPFSACNNLHMMVVQSSKGKKPVIYKM